MESHTNMTSVTTDEPVGPSRRPTVLQRIVLEGTRVERVRVTERGVIGNALQRPCATSRIRHGIQATTANRGMDEKKDGHTSNPAEIETAQVRA
jgi:hypothetical protein